MPKTGYDSDTESDSDNSDDEDESSARPGGRQPGRAFRGFDGLEPVVLADRVKEHLKRSTEADKYKQDEVAQILNTRIYYSKRQWSPQAERDFKRADAAFREGDLQTLQKLKTRFCIAHYRGVTYGRNNFSAIARRNHRQDVEAGVRPIYSVSVLESLGVDVSDYNSGLYDDTPVLMEALQERANLLKEILLAKRAALKDGFKYGSITFDSYADALQHIYTNNYKHTFSSIKVALASKQGLLKDRTKLEHLKKKPPEIQRKTRFSARYGMQNLPRDWEAYEGLFNGANPFVSTGDTPRHALKYALGMKFYGDLVKHRLFPGWSAETGRVKKPYSGKVYILLHSLNEFIEDAPLHVPTLNTQGRIRVADEIVEEREATFPSFIPRKRVVWEHVTKFPSFDGYTDQHLEKYGLTEEDFEQYKAALFTSPNRTESTHKSQIQESRAIEAWLVNFHEVRLIEIARRIAESRGMILVYQGADGGLSRELASVRRDADVDNRLWQREPNHQFQGHDYSFAYGSELQRLLTLMQEKGASLADEFEFNQTLSTRFTRHPVLGDGNCLFRALADAANRLAIPSGPLNHLSARAHVYVSYLQTPSLVQACNINSAYLLNMRQAATDAADLSRWGSEHEIMAFAVYYRLRICVFLGERPSQDLQYQVGNVVDVQVSRDERCVWFTPTAHGHAGTLYLLHEHGNHFTPLAPRPGAPPLG
ncbi:hypothetical protein G4177_26910 [Corallococcus sp. ZKHCc1 1396]|uniref:OTU domain-containing protein n=1 Tax=Corallococcus soli TaxID=2710757 RepID=A0ABR9PV65_9BACT|nr:OTU domain-containing protein [Corallococcus soli]MBE4751806.1 hypothetical protein [Corallococcus soli]